MSRVYVGSNIMWGLQFGTLDKLPEFERYAAGLAQRPAHIRASEIDDRLLAENPVRPPAASSPARRR